MQRDVIRVVFAYQIMVNTSTRKRVPNILQKKFHYLTKFRFIGTCSQEIHFYWITLKDSTSKVSAQVQGTQNSSQIILLRYKHSERVGFTTN